MVALAGYSASFLPAIYAQTNFWTSSPTFFFVRLGILMTLVGGAYALHANVYRAPGAHRLCELGRSSLFVYWIHVEMAYGVLSAPLHRRLPLEWAYVGVHPVQPVAVRAGEAERTRPNHEVHDGRERPFATVALVSLRDPILRDFEIFVLVAV